MFEKTLWVLVVIAMAIMTAALWWQWKHATKEPRPPMTAEKQVELARLLLEALPNLERKLEKEGMGLILAVESPDSPSGFSNAQQMLRELEGADIQLGINGYERTAVEELFLRARFVKVAPIPKPEIITTSYLGLGMNSSLDEVYATAADRGLVPYPASVAAQLWLQYPDLVGWGGELLMATEPVTLPRSGDPYLLLFRNNSGERHIRLVPKKIINPSELVGHWWKENTRWAFIPKGSLPAPAPPEK